VKIFLQFIGLTCCVLAFSGCEWTAGGGVDSWNESGSWGDFSGSYKSADGGILVRQFGGGTTPVTNTISGEVLATGTGSATAFEGQTAYTPVRGSLTIFTVGGYRFTDDPSSTADTVSLTVTPADGSTGRFNYSTRAWALTFPAPLASGTQILGTYQYAALTPIQGNHGNAIYSFVVQQTGNKLQFIDSNASTYTGALGTTTSNSTSFAAQFSVAGVSQGYEVTIVGIFSAVVSAGSSGSKVMKATYIEDGGNEADINAVAN